ncbi:IS66 family transposase [soil metagenome]
MDYGTRAHRPVPDHVDEEIGVPLPDACPCCEGELVFEDEVDQYQEDVAWVRGHVRRFRVSRGRCRSCGRRAQGRHPDQTSDAVGAAASQVGPRAVAIAAQLNKELGVAMGKVSQILGLFGVKVTAGGLYQAIGRLARAAEPTCQALVLAVAQSTAVAADETGWRVAGWRQWLWVFVGDDGVTVYLIAPGRGYEQARSVIGERFAGALERDGWAPYRRFEHARHQTCLAHLLRRAGELIADSVAGQAKIPHAVRRLLQEALAVRDSHQDLLPGGDVIDGTCVEITDDQPLLGPASVGHGHEIIPARQDRQAHLDAEIARLQRQLDALLARNPTHAPNRKLLKHLANERDHLLTFLSTPGVQATNWRAEQAIRPAVVNRKSWGGNRTPHGAQVQQTLMSVIRTSRQQHVCPIALLEDLQRQRTPAPSSMLRLPTTTADPRGP